MIQNCFIKARPNDPRSKFCLNLENGIENLDGYAIIPREEYDALVKGMTMDREPEHMEEQS